MIIRPNRATDRPELHRMRLALWPTSEEAELDQVLDLPWSEGIWVDPVRRRSGLAAALVREGEAWARELGLTEMASDCELENHISHAFHLGSGFEEVQRNICFRRALVGKGRT